MPHVLGAHFSRFSKRSKCFLFLLLDYFLCREIFNDLIVERTLDERKFSVYLNVFYFFIFIYIFFIVRQREFRKICSSSLESLLPALCISFLFSSMEFHCYPYYIATFSFDRSKLHENLIDELFFTSIEN